MIEIDVQQVFKGYGGQSVLCGLSFSVVSGEHVGLVGANGAGKTTLLKILTGQELPDKGQVFVPHRAQMGLLSQLPVYPEGTTAEQVLRGAFARVTELEEQLRRLEPQLSENNASLLKQYGELSHLHELLGGFTIEVELARICNGLGLSAALLARPMSKLSGGEQTRINLARLLLGKTELLLLDEPTNHLDLRACEWLEDYLQTFKGTVLAVSHDRFFLDKFAKRIVELQEGKAAFYSGNYSFYVTERETRRLEQERLYEKEQQAHEKLAAAAKQMHIWAGQNAKLHKRAFSMEKRAARILKTDRPRIERAYKGDFAAADFQADDIFRLKGIAKQFGQTQILQDVSLTMRNGERIALLGDNGTGKSTLLKLLTGELLPEEGNVWQGPSVKAGYLPQTVTFAHPERTLIDTMLYELDLLPDRARNRLAAFHFTGDKVFDTVSALSGGERSRLMLCLLMGRSVNLLLLDEPTNHLDIASREWVESSLDDFDQAILFVSHDRYFIEQFATRVWWLEQGQIWDFEGTYAAFREALAARTTPVATRGVATATQSVANATSSATHNAPTPKGGAARQNTSPLARKRQQEQTALRLEKQIEALEAELHALEEQLVLAATDADTLLQLLETQSMLQSQREKLYADYETLAEQMADA